ncbi:hypothetical protein Tsubulata_030380 [Turnera subulata]|uniref:RRM domain-containing protein n=1 Tax=Turnera subulata TaxID=218843 RepID=A0A9Q0FRL7_9ROSI|nr:hypothetical protein Tsubulata_030380 [Turnera subulata]
MDLTVLPCSLFSTGLPPLPCSPLSPGLPQPSRPSQKSTNLHHSPITTMNHQPASQPFFHRPRQPAFHCPQQPSTIPPDYAQCIKQSSSTLPRLSLLPLPSPNLRNPPVVPPLTIPHKNNLTQNLTKNTLRNPIQTHLKPQQFSKWNQKQIQNISNNQTVTNLYVGNLPLQWSAIELHVILSKFDEIIDMYIPAKRAKNGKHFGFVRYRACRDINRLISSINHIQVGNGSLQALPAHDRPHTRQTPQNFNNSSLPPTFSHQNPPKSFVDIIKGPTSPSPKRLQPITDKANITFSPLPCETEWLSNCALGILSEPLDPHLVSQLFLKHGHPVIISDLGGDSVIIQFPSPKDMSSFINSNPEWVSSIFDLMRPLQTSDGPSNRKVWVMARGIPLHAWSSGFFHTLVSRFGSLIKIANLTENKSRLDYAFLQVITTVSKPIAWEISALIDDSTFRIIIDEIP